MSTLPSNVDTSKPPAERVRAYWAMAKQVVHNIDRVSVQDSNAMRFLLHVAFHEGAQLTKRSQMGGGPGRSFSQFEAPRAKDALLYAERKLWLPLLAGVLNQTVETLRSETAKLPEHGNWPAGGLVEQWLLQNDLFGALMTRIVLRKIPAPIGPTLPAHAEYWADHWKIVFTGPADRAAKIQQFLRAAQRADSLLPRAGK